MKLVNGFPCEELEPGNATGCFELRNRGLFLMAEITCWPRRKNYVLTTGGHDPSSLKSADKSAIYEHPELVGSNPRDEADIIRERWLGTQRWGVLAAEEHARDLFHKMMAFMYAGPEQKEPEAETKVVETSAATVSITHSKRKRDGLKLSVVNALGDVGIGLTT